MEDQEVTLQEIERAAAVLKGVTRVTPLDHSRTLSEQTGMDLYLKMENFQRSGSFKMRGAYYKIHSLTDSERKKGVVAASAGNHAQGVAHAALFGSVARGEDRPDSDIDIMIEIAPDSRMDLFRYVGIVQFIEELFPVPVDVANREGLKPFVRPSAERDAVYAF